MGRGVDPACIGLVQGIPLSFGSSARPHTKLTEDRGTARESRV